MEVSNPIRSNPYKDEPQAADGMGTDTRSAREIYQEIILENIEYRHLVQNNQIDRERLDELVELIVTRSVPQERPSVLPETIIRRRW